MSRVIAIGRELARRRPPGSVVDKIAKLGEAERAQVSSYLDQLDAEVQRRLVQLQTPIVSNDTGNFDRVLTFFRVPKGVRRENMLWRYSLASAFALSLWAGHWQARTYLVGQQQEQTASYAA
ncbi:unnamed protein product [Urochloa decumbens]|uniref:Uncharacterized protein n=1 Tax=Urochloa decumbens TaxID=240449 RepID=A0ABC9D8Z2_9POAL